MPFLFRSQPQEIPVIPFQCTTTGNSTSTEVALSMESFPGKEASKILMLQFWIKIFKVANKHLIKVQTKTKQNIPQRNSLSCKHSEYR